MFNVKRNSRISPSGCSIFSFCQQNMRIPDALPSANTWYCKFLILAILVGITWYLAVALFCISRMTSHAEHLFMGLSAICVSFVKYLLMSFAHFFSHWVVCLPTSELCNYFPYSKFKFFPKVYVWWLFAANLWFAFLEQEAFLPQTYSFLIEGKLLHNIVLASTIHQHESVTGIHVSPPSSISLPPPTPSHPSKLLRSPRFEFLDSNKFPLVICFTHGRIYASKLLSASSHPLLPLPPPVSINLRTGSFSPLPLMPPPGQLASPPPQSFQIPLDSLQSFSFLLCRSASPFLPLILHKTLLGAQFFFSKRVSSTWKEDVSPLPASPPPSSLSAGPWLARAQPHINSLFLHPLYSSVSPPLLPYPSWTKD